MTPGLKGLCQRTKFMKNRQRESQCMAIQSRISFKWAKTIQNKRCWYQVTRSQARPTLQRRKEFITQKWSLALTQTYNRFIISSLHKCSSQWCRSITWVLVQSRCWCRILRSHRRWWLPTKGHRSQRILWVIIKLGLWPQMNTTDASWLRRRSIWIAIICHILMEVLFILTNVYQTRRGWPTSWNQWGNMKVE